MTSGRRERSAPASPPACVSLICRPQSIALGVHLILLAAHAGPRTRQTSRGGGGAEAQSTHPACGGSLLPLSHATLTDGTTRRSGRMQRRCSSAATVGATTREGGCHGRPPMQRHTKHLRPDQTTQTPQRDDNSTASGSSYDRFLSTRSRAHRCPPLSDSITSLTSLRARCFLSALHSPIHLPLIGSLTRPADPLFPRSSRRSLRRPPPMRR